MRERYSSITHAVKMLSAMYGWICVTRNYIAIFLNVRLCYYLPIKYTHMDLALECENTKHANIVEITNALWWNQSCIICVVTITLYPKSHNSVSMDWWIASIPFTMAPFFWMEIPTKWLVLSYVIGDKSAYRFTHAYRPNEYSHEVWKLAPLLRYFFYCSLQYIKKQDSRHKCVLAQQKFIHSAPSFTVNSINLWSFC